MNAKETVLCTFVLSLAAVARGHTAVSPRRAAPGELEIAWLSHDCRPGDGLMVAGWGSLFRNASIVVDGIELPTLGRSENAIITKLPTSAKPGRHSIILRAGMVEGTPSTGLNDADLWWCQGDEGINATQSGWIRCFGRSIWSDTETLRPSINLRQQLTELLRHPALSVSEIERLLAQHHESRDRRGSTTPTLMLTPVGGGSPTTLEASDFTDGYSVQFAVPGSLTPGYYNINVTNSAGGPPAALKTFLSPAQPLVSGINILGGRSPDTILFDITHYGPTGLNYSNPNHTIWAGHDTYYDASGPLRSAIAAAATAVKKARSVSTNGSIPDHVVYLPPGIYHFQGGFNVSDGVYIKGAGADVTAVYFAYDDQNSAPLAYFAPEVPGASWGLSDFSIYCLSFFYSIVHVPAANVGRFRASGLTIRADAFHNMNGVGGNSPNNRTHPWGLNANATFGGVGGYQPAVFRFGQIDNTTSPNVTTIGPFGAATNVQVQDCDISGTWHIMNGKIEHSVLSRNTLYNGALTFYLVARQTIIEDNAATGSSPVAGGNGFNFAQNLYMARNDIRNVRGNDREVMTYDAEGAQYFGAPLKMNATHIMAPNCPGRMDSRFLPVDPQNTAPAGGVVAILEGPGAGTYRRIVDWGMTGDPNTAPCWWRLNEGFPSALQTANMTAISMVVTFYAGHGLFIDNSFSDTGHFQLYHSGIENVLAGTTLTRVGGAWAGGMVDGIRYYSNNSLGKPIPNPTLMNEFVDNTVAVGHRAEHVCNTKNMTRTSFWACQPAHQMFSFGMDGQGGPLSNRFMTFTRNNITGGNGVLLWGLGNKDVLVSGNSFNTVENPIGIDQFPAGTDTVENYVVIDSRLN